MQLLLSPLSAYFSLNKYELYILIAIQSIRLENKIVHMLAARGTGAQYDQ